MWTLLLLHVGLGVLVWDWTTHLLGWRVNGAWEPCSWWGFWREVGYQLELWDAREGYPLHKYRIKCRYCLKWRLAHPHRWDGGCGWEPKEEPEARPAHYIPFMDLYAHIRVPDIEGNLDPQRVQWARGLYHLEMDRIQREFTRMMERAIPRPVNEEIEEEDDVEQQEGH